jgi:shikimate 5-dehydrogenase
MTAGTAAKSAAPTERREGVAAGVVAARTEDRAETAARALEAAASFIVVEERGE